MSEARSTCGAAYPPSPDRSRSGLHRSIPWTSHVYCGKKTFSRPACVNLIPVTDSDPGLGQKEICMYGGGVSTFVPKSVEAVLREKVQSKR